MGYIVGMLISDMSAHIFDLMFQVPRPEEKVMLRARLDVMTRYLQNNSGVPEPTLKLLSEAAEYLNMYLDLGGELTTFAHLLVMSNAENGYKQLLAYLEMCNDQGSMMLEQELLANDGRYGNESIASREPIKALFLKEPRYILSKLESYYDSLVPSEESATEVRGIAGRLLAIVVEIAREIGSNNLYEDNKLPLSFDLEGYLKELRLIYLSSIRILSWWVAYTAAAVGDPVIGRIIPKISHVFADAEDIYQVFTNPENLDDLSLAFGPNRNDILFGLKGQIELKDGIIPECLRNFNMSQIYTMDVIFTYIYVYGDVYKMLVVEDGDKRREG